MSTIKTHREAPSESTPLLDPLHSRQSTIEEDIAEHVKVYDRFTPATKRFIVVLVSCIGLLPILVFTMIVPSIPQIARDLDSDGETVSLAVSVAMMTSAIETPIWATYSTYYGRRLMYLLGLPFLILGSIGVGRSSSVNELLVWRFVQAFGTVAGVPMGKAVIGDIYKLEERGAAMGAFFSVTHLAPAVAGVLGGLLAHYASWRWVQYAQGAGAAVIFIAVLFFFPETIHPNERLLEKINARRDQPKRFVLINPFRSLTTLRALTCSALMLTELCLLASQQTLMVPLAYTIGERYGIENEFFIGACAIPWGIGVLFASPLAGIISDRLIVKWRKRRNGDWVPEDRLRGAILAGAFVCVPFSMLLSAFSSRYVDGIPGVALAPVAIFFNGFGINLVFPPIAAYCVDVMHNRSVETLAAMNSTVGALLGLIVAGIVPSIHKHGIALTDTVGAAIALIGGLVMWTVIHYGEQMREWSGIEYSTLTNN